LWLSVSERDDESARVPPPELRRERATVALRHRDFRLLWMGEFVSALGTQMQTVALGWQLYLLTGDPLQLGVLGLMRAIPTVTFAMVGGALADARDRRALLLITQTVLALFSVVLAIATMADQASVALIYVLTILTATASCFDDPARQALIPNLVPRERLAHATTLNILAHNIAAVAGPAVGGIAIATVGLSATYWLDAASFAGVIGALLMMHSRPEVPVLAQGGVQAVLDGIRFVRKNPVILSLMTLDFLATLFGASLVLMPIFAQEILKVGEEGLGLLYAAPAAGAVAGGIILSMLPVSHRPGRLVIGAVACYGVAIAIFGASDAFVVALLALATSGAADTVSMTFRHTIRQLATPDEMRGRMAAVHSVFAGGGPELGNFEAGVAARLLGTQTAVVAGGIGCALLAIGTAFLAPQIRDYEVGEPEQRAPSDG
jgi:MFS family permease